MIADFGCSQLKDLTLNFTNTSRPGFSIRWAAPELLDDESGSSDGKKADVYAYGMTALEILTGDIPFCGLQDRQVMIAVAIKRKTPDRPKVGVSTEVWKILQRCWAWDPSKRPEIGNVEWQLRGLHSQDPTRTTGQDYSETLGRTMWGTLPRILARISTQKRKGKAKAVYDDDGELLPLDGEEGELTYGEACFMEPRESGGIDLVTLLPPKMALYIIAQLDLDSIVACLAVSHGWRRLALDDTVWRTLFYRQPGWSVNLSRRRAQILAQSISIQPSRSPSLLSSLTSRRTSEPKPSLNWQDLYKHRHRIARRWYFGAAQFKKLSGHLDNVYCLELDTLTDTIVTGSRDCSIKVWSVSSGELKETLAAHEGSVLCLKVDFARGFMYSGSSDRTIRVWERSAGGWEVKVVLSGHAGGVMDLRMDERWIVSCSKDTLIRVWDRQTLKLHCILRGHEGPVNAVSLQGNHVVSAGGDRAMILWDIESASRVRTFSGHDMGLACVEFKGDTIISGSKDCKIKVWSASSGECVMTLPGHELLVRALAYDAVMGRLVSVSYDRAIKVWECKGNGWKFVREFRNLHDGDIFDVKFDATKIISVSSDQKILVLDFAYDLDGLLFT